MLWVKAFHVIFMVTWFAGLFYLPRLFVYHAMTDDPAGRERFKTMERKLYYGIMTPGAILTIAFGIWLLFAYAWSAWHSTGWLHAWSAITCGADGWSRISPGIATVTGIAGIAYSTKCRCCSWSPW
jgi:putative membrane protein